MKKRDNWQPSKYVFKKRKLIASRDRKEVGVASRLIADLVAKLYQKNLKQYAKGKLLDLGCGKVPLYGAYKEYVTDNICVDWENTLHKNEYLDFECDLTKDLPFDDNEFDTVILSDVLEHIPQPEKLWKEMYRILSKDGKLILNVPFYYWIHEQPHDYYRYTEFALKRFVDETGLTLVNLECIGGSPEILADILAKHVNFLPLIGPTLAIFIQYVIATFIKTALGKKISVKTSKSFPYGYFLVAEKLK
jgi:SAM-dependent methyltransferase